MARILKTFSSRMVFAVLVVHAVLLPLLSYGLLTVVRNVQEDVFIDQVRIYARVLADVMQANGRVDPETELLEHLDSSMMSGRCVHAVLRFKGKTLVSSLMDADEAASFVEDYAFGMHDDNVYYLSSPLIFGAEMAVLELGFDEVPTLEQIESARSTILYIVVTYLVISLVLAGTLSALMTRPLQRLRLDSHKIASGDYTRQLSVDSEVFEINELSRDLEAMRGALVGVNEELQAEIVNRELAETERRNAENHLRHAHRLQSIGTLAGGVAHEFNNVLLPIRMYTDLALEDLPKDSPVRPNLERVMRLADRAKGLSAQILTFGRQAEDVNMVPLDIAPVVAEALTMVRALIPASIKIHEDIEPEIGAVLCDPNEIQQLVVNLCSNAYQALSKGGGLLEVKLDKCQVSADFVKKHPKLVEGDYAHLVVADSGEGMDAYTLQRIFDPFYTTRDVGKGTGLGLSVVHGIVAKHEGEIIVTSELGQGTSVDVYFPLVVEQSS